MRLLAALLLAGSIALPASAKGYTIEEDGDGHRLHWRQSDLPVRYHLATGNVAAGEAGEAAVHRAARSWSIVSDTFAFRFGGFVNRPRWGHDGRNTALWIDREWPFDETLIATTVRTYRRDDGHMIDADALFNAETYRWAVGGADEVDVENAAAHELGHAAGLGHSSDGGATMFRATDPGETRKRTLEDDDRQALTALYGSAALGAADEGSARSAAGSLGAGGGGGGGCSISHRTTRDDPWPLWIAALLVVLALRSTGHRRTATDEPSIRLLDRRRTPRVTPAPLEGVIVELGSERLRGAMLDLSLSGLRLRLRARSPAERAALEKMVSRRRAVEIDLPGIGVKTAIPVWHVRERRGWTSAGFRVRVARAAGRTTARGAASDPDPSEAARRAFLLHLQGRRSAAGAAGAEACRAGRRLADCTLQLAAVWGPGTPLLSFPEAKPLLRAAEDLRRLGEQASDREALRVALELRITAMLAYGGRQPALAAVRAYERLGRRAGDGSITRAGRAFRALAGLLLDPGGCHAARARRALDEMTACAPREKSPALAGSLVSSLAVLMTSAPEGAVHPRPGRTEVPSD